VFLSRGQQEKVTVAEGRAGHVYMARLAAVLWAPPSCTPLCNLVDLTHIRYCVRPAAVLLHPAEWPAAGCEAVAAVE
jgi:hypothetical protein